MENFILDQVKPILKYVPKNIIKSYFIPQSNEATREFRGKNGFIRGVCHPSESFEQVKDANIEWARFDVPFPFDKDGKEKPSYYAVRDEFAKIK